MTNHQDSQTAEAMSSEHGRRGDTIDTASAHAGHRQRGSTDHDPHAAHRGQGSPGGHGGHGGHGDHAAMFRDKFRLTFVLTVPIVAYSDMIQMWFGFTAPTFPGSTWIAPVLGTVVFFYGGWPFLTGGLDELKRRRPGMMLLITLAITVAYAASLATTFGLLTGLD